MDTIGESNMTMLNFVGFIPWLITSKYIYVRSRQTYWQALARCYPFIIPSKPTITCFLYAKLQCIVTAKVFWTLGHNLKLHGDMCDAIKQKESELSKKTVVYKCIVYMLHFESHILLKIPSKQDLQLQRYVSCYCIIHVENSLSMLDHITYANSQHQFLTFTLVHGTLCNTCVIFFNEPHQQKQQILPNNQYLFKQSSHQPHFHFDVIEHILDFEIFVRFCYYVT